MGQVRLVRGHVAHRETAVCRGDQRGQLWRVVCTAVRDMNRRDDVREGADGTDQCAPSTRLIRLSFASARPFSCRASMSTRLQRITNEATLEAHVKRVDMDIRYAYSGLDGGEATKGQRRTERGGGSAPCYRRAEGDVHGGCKKSRARPEQLAAVHRHSRGRGGREMSNLWVRLVGKSGDSTVDCLWIKSHGARGRFGQNGTLPPLLAGGTYEIAVA
jgi:hypothetical protein